MPLLRIRDPESTKTIPIARLIVKASPRVRTDRIEPNRGIKSLYTPNSPAEWYFRTIVQIVKAVADIKAP